MKKNSIVSLFLNVWKYAPSKRRVIFFVVLAMLAQAVMLMEPIVIGKIFNSVQFESGDPDIFNFLLKGFGLIALIEIGFWAFHGPSRIIERKNAFMVRKNYKEQMVGKVLDLPVSWHKNNHSGDTIDKINKASSDLFDFSGSIFQLVGVAVRFIGSVVILTIFDWRIILIAGIVAALSVIIVVSFDRVLIRGYRKILKANNFLASGIHDYISNIITVVTLRLKKRAMKDVDVRSMKAFPVYKKNANLDELKWFLVSMNILVMTLAVLILSAFESYRNEGVIVIGTLFVLYRYLSEIGGAFYTFAWKYSGTVEQNSSIVAAEVLLEEHKKIKKEKKRNLPVDWKEIRIDGIDFNYDDEKIEDKAKINFRGGNIKNVSLSFYRGQKVAFVGESGSGKSTLLSLIRGLHHSRKAEVSCDGKVLSGGLRNLNEDSLLVPQDPEIFNATAEYNITMGAKGKVRDLQKTIKMAMIDGVVKKLKHGLETNVMEKGVSLSGGEKQRLALARGLYVADDYDFLLFDEPTSSVDSENELKIYLSIFKSFSDKTIFSAVHRLHLLRYFDYIYFFKNGKVIAQGDFNDLLQDKNFAELWETYNKKED